MFLAGGGLRARRKRSYGATGIGAYLLRRRRKRSEMCRQYVAWTEEDAKRQIEGVW